MKPKILLEDDSLLVIAKPSGWIVNNAQTTKGKDTIQDWVGDNFNFPTAKSREFRGGIVHRLDKETSGVLVLAKTESAFVELQRQFKERKIKKTYLALVHGAVKSKEGEIVAPVGRLPWRRDRFGVLPGGRDAKTSYIVQDYFEMEGEKFSLVELYPETGRTHQIRIHLKHIGHPIVADDFYAGRKTARKDRKWCPRLFLHAHKIRFVHPEMAKAVSVTSPLSQDLELVLENLNGVEI